MLIAYRNFNDTHKLLGIFGSKEMDIVVDKDKNIMLGLVDSKMGISRGELCFRSAKRLAEEIVCNECEEKR
ncbi:MAG: hypothetical protein LBG21_04085 [Campylobacteraceae bacterium]|jgi:hypothetical protein|nr:hypothetical protein [Campylobacteraceae bacterium]